MCLISISDDNLSKKMLKKTKTKILKKADKKKNSMKEKNKKIINVRQTLNKQKYTKF